MNIAISNIAWNRDENERVISLLEEFEIYGIEVAPTKIWSNPIQVSKNEIQTYKKYWNKNGIKIIALQSLLFGYPKISIFDSAENRKQIVSYLNKIIRLGSTLGVSAVVFGSPANRKIGNLDSRLVYEIASEFFNTIGDLAKRYEIYFCIEAVPKKYGNDFLTTSNEVIEYVSILNHSYIGVHLDSGAMFVNKENYSEVIQKAQPFYHFHISEPELKSVPFAVDHNKIHSALLDIEYNRWISIEMRGNESSINVDQIKKTLIYVTSIYK